MLSIAAWAIVWSLIPHPPLTSPPVPQQQASAQSYSVDGEIGLSAVFVDVNGSEEKYRSDYNYTPGFNLRSFALNLSSEEPGQTLVDFLNLQGSGFGDSDPSEQAVLSFGRRGSFEFNGPSCPR